LACLKHLLWRHPPISLHFLLGGQQITWGMHHPSCTPSWAAKAPSAWCDLIHQGLTE
jgi:hypothetical protein